MRRKITPEQYQAELDELGTGIRAVEPYAGAHVKILHECQHGHPWHAIPTNVKSGVRCKTCHLESRRSHDVFDLDTAKEG